MKKVSTFVLFLISCHFMSAQLEVIDVFPASHSLTVERMHTISISFPDQIDLNSFDGNNFQVFGKWSGPMTGTIESNGAITGINFTPDEEFIAGEMVTVNLSTGVLNMGGSENLTNGYAFSYWIKTEPAGLNLQLVQTLEMKLEGETFIQCYGAYAGDLNDDGFSDLTVVNENSNDLRVLINDGEGVYNDFTIYGMPSGSKPSPNEPSDFNQDGFIDLAVGHVQSEAVSIMMGDGQGGFSTEVGYTAEQGVRGIGVIDLEADGHMDVVTANRNASNISLLKNNGLGVFDEINNIPGMSQNETALAIADANNDGIMDLFVGAYTGSEVFIMLNDGEGNFSEGGTAAVNGRSWMVATGDVNGDGNVDLVSANATGDNCSVHFGDGAGGFTDSYFYETGNFSLAIDLGDLDGDGDLDMISSNYSGIDYTLYENDGNGIFINPITYPAAAAGSCAIFHDRDNNGTMDLTLVDEIQDVVFIYENSPVDGLEDIVTIETKISPNPFQDIADVVIEGIHQDALQITNSCGQLIAELQPKIEGSKTTYRWDSRSDIGSGLYFINLPKANISIKKLIKL